MQLIESQEFQETFYPLGYPVEIATNSETVLLAARENWSESRLAFREKPVQIRITAVIDGRTRLPVNPTFHIERHFLTVVSDVANYGVADLTEAFAVCFLGESALRNRPWLRYHFLDAITYTILDAIFFTPVHAGCVALHDRGVLLCGESEAGKSSLAYACARGGWTFISDDASHLLHGNERIVAGHSHEMRFREPAKDLFPELRKFPATLRANGKMTIEIRTSKLPGIRTAPHAKVHHIVLLNRRPGPAELKPACRGEALRWVQAVLPIKYEPIWEQYLRDLNNLLEAEYVELHYQDLDAAVRLLESLVSKG